jgi:hypothetical protein
MSVVASPRIAENRDTESARLLVKKSAARSGSPSLDAYERGRHRGHARFPGFRILGRRASCGLPDRRPNVRRLHGSAENGVGLGDGAGEMPMNAADLTTPAVPRKATVQTVRDAATSPTHRRRCGFRQCGRDDGDVVKGAARPRPGGIHVSEGTAFGAVEPRSNPARVPAPLHLCALPSTRRDKNNASAYRTA